MLTKLFVFNVTIWHYRSGHWDRSTIYYVNVYTCMPHSHLLQQEIRKFYDNEAT